MREGLAEEHLAVYDLLCRQKDDLTPQARGRVKAVARELVAAVRAEIALMNAWRANESTQAQVRSLIYDFLYDEQTGLPDAYAPEEIRSAVLSSPLPSPLGGEDADPARLRDDLDRIRAQGYAVSREEWMPHAGDISVPLFDGRGCFAAQLGVAGIAESVLGGFAETLRRLLGAARSIRNKL